jgi:group II intron reverse transcriptase/maturase
MQKTTMMQALHGEFAAYLAQSETLSTWRSPLYGTWEVSVVPPCIGPVHEGQGHTMNKYAIEKSDLVIVPKKVPNKGHKSPAEVPEGRARPKGNCLQDAAAGTQCLGIASIGLHAVRKAAQRNKYLRFTALLHHITVELLSKSYQKLKHGAKAGIDGVTWKSYGENLKANLIDLHQRIHKGSYRSKPARRVYIPKSDGSQRPLSIWSLEDKIVQQAVVEVLNAIYEADFRGFSYGFRPNRGQHDALDALQVAIYRKKVNWIWDADIRKFFDTVEHDQLLKLLQHRIQDKRILRLIKKWLRVGVIESGQHTRSKVGIPQGAVISPVLANVYLHYVYDQWIHNWRNRRATGDVIVIRYADDTIVGFQYQKEAIEFQKALEIRLNQFGLSLHPDKTRLIRFGRFASAQSIERGLRKPETFDFLGFTHYGTKSIKNGWFVVGRKTIKKRMKKQLQLVKEELRKRMCRPVPETGRWLHRTLLGHLNYYAVPGNGKSISSFFYRVSWYWLRSLRRRSQRHRMTWERFGKLRDKYFPKVRITHPQPIHRFDARTQGRSPVR